MQLLDLLILLFATFYTADVVTRQSGPFAVFATLRRLIPTQVLSCLVCFSVYAAVGVYLLWRIVPEAATVLALAGAAVFVDRLTD